MVVLGTGGTIAGTAASAADHTGYSAAQIGVQQLLAGLPALQGINVQAEQLAQVDSKDMGPQVWRALALRVAEAVAQPEVAGIVITHGTDTMEETAYLLQRMLAPRKPVVLTGAMRPATALAPDGPQNIADALAVAATPGAQGVMVVFAGQVLAAAEVRKQHPYRLAAFDAGDAGPVAWVEQGQLRRLRAWPVGEALGAALLQPEAEAWPWVAVLPSHGGADTRQVQALVSAGVRALVVAGTGNGTLHEALLPALRQAQAQGVAVWQASRCAQGALVGDAFEFRTVPGLSAWQLRVEALLQLLAAEAASSCS